MNMNSQNQGAKEYLSRPLDDLLVELEFYGPRQRKRTVSKTNMWKSIEPELKRFICEQWNWCEKRADSRFQNLETLAIVLAEVLVNAILPTNIPLILISSIVVKMGLDSFCKCNN